MLTIFKKSVFQKKLLSTHHPPTPSHTDVKFHITISGNMVAMERKGPLTPFYVFKQKYIKIKEVKKSRLLILFYGAGSALKLAHEK